MSYQLKSSNVRLYVVTKSGVLTINRLPLTRGVTATPANGPVTSIAIFSPRRVTLVRLVTESSLLVSMTRLTSSHRSEEKQNRREWATRRTAPLTKGANILGQQLLGKACLCPSTPVLLVDSLQ